MCCGDQCLGFVPVKIASLVFGYIIAIISALGTIAFFLGLCTGLSILTNGHHAETGIILITPVLIEFTSSFVCSVFLLVGLTQKIPKLVKAFLMYGMIQVALLLVFFIVLRCISHWFQTDHLFMAFSTLVIYSLCLFMVYAQYQSMIAVPAFENLQPERGLLPGGFQIVN